ncbi:MAG: DotU family type IV/VI secretion system protein [Fibrobacterales bacterium]
MNSSFIKHAAPLINMGVQIQSVQFESPAKLQEDILEKTEAFVEAAIATGKSDGEVEEAKYGLLSFLDELIFKNSSIGYEWLEYRLMMKVFNDQLAGESFFTKFDTFVNDDTKRDLAEFYGVLMLLGFQGKFQLEGLEGLQLKIKEVTDILYPNAEGAVPDLSKFATIAPGTLPREKSGKSFLLYAFGLVILSGIAYMALLTFAQV